MHHADASTASPLMCLPPELREPLPTQASQHLQVGIANLAIASCMCCGQHACTAICRGWKHRMDYGMDQSATHAI